MAPIRGAGRRSLTERLSFIILAFGLFLPERTELIDHGLLVELAWPQCFWVGGRAHGGCQVVVYFWVGAIELGNVLFDVLTHGVPIIGTGIFEWLDAEAFYHFADFALAVVEQGAQDGDVRA